MIGVDTNVVVRLLVGDDRDQQRVARDYLYANCSMDDPAWICRTVAIETVWVLERTYRQSRQAISGALERLLDTAEIEFEDADIIRRALREYESGSGFSDALIALTNLRAGCSKTVTFDANASRKLRSFELLQ